jgi:hypothetical protein
MNASLADTTYVHDMFVANSPSIPESISNLSFLDL